MTLLKNFYDSYPDLKIVYIGSAMLTIENSVADPIQTTIIIHSTWLVVS